MKQNSTLHLCRVYPKIIDFVLLEKKIVMVSFFGSVAQEIDVIINYFEETLEAQTVLLLESLGD